MTAFASRAFVIPGVHVHGAWLVPLPTSPPFPITCALCDGWFPAETLVADLAEHLRTHHKGRKYSEAMFERGPVATLDLALELAAEGVPVAPAESFYQRDVPWILPDVYVNGRWVTGEFTREPPVIRARWARWPFAGVTSPGEPFARPSPRAPKNWPRSHPKHEPVNGYCCASAASGSRFCPHQIWMSTAKRAARFEAARSGANNDKYTTEAIA